MKLAVLGAALAAAVSLTSCSAVVAPPTQPRSLTTGGTVTVEPDLVQEGSAQPAGPGPLRLDDAEGEGCASLRFGREFTAWEHVLEPDADITITGWSLIDAEDVKVGRGFVAELPGRVPVSGFTLGFPPKRDVVGTRHVDWEGRRPAAGATLEAGTRSNLWLRVQVADDVRRAGYQGLRLHYTADGQAHTAESDLRLRFRWRCS